MRTAKAVQKCEQAMAELLAKGWRKDQLHYLEELWWQIHTDDGDIWPVKQQSIKGDCPCCNRSFGD